MLVAVMPWSGHNQEDAIHHMAEGAATRGLFSHMVYNVLPSIMKRGEKSVC